MKIAHIGSKGLPSRGATERVVEAIASRHALEHDVTVYGSRRVCESGEYEGVRVVALPVPGGAANGLDRLILLVLFTEVEKGGLLPRPDTMLVTGWS